MKSRINYFMEKDTRLVLDNLKKEIINENILLINYTILKKKIKNGKITVMRYIRDKNRMLIYKTIKKYNLSIYKGFIDWAENNEIEWHSIGKEEI